MSRRRTLPSIVRDMFELYGHTVCYYSRRNSNNPIESGGYMEVPIKDDVFELPLLAFPDFNGIMTRDADTETEALVVDLNTTGSSSSYRTLDRVMQDVLLESFSSSRLVAIKMEQPGGNLICYGTHGAIFDEDFNPMLLCSYQVQRYTQGEETRYSLIRPIIRVNPDTFKSRETPMQKFINNKLLIACLEENLHLPYTYHLHRRIDTDDARLPARIEIDSMPFIIHKPDVPSISTTNQQLLQLALDHIDEELIQ
jgi:hypothetical protein